MESEALKHYFKKTYDEYADAIFRFCLMKTSNKEQAEDLVQETFMRLWQSLRDGKEMQNVRAYLYTIANNLVTDWYRKRKPESLTALEEKGFEAKDVTSETPLREAEHAEVLRLVEQLDEGDRAVLLMRFIEGIEPREIAEMLGESANVISVRIHRALKRVRQSIEPNTEI
jgi:RNA polymerase sigma-70 factor, ECF subfamily